VCGVRFQRLHGPSKAFSLPLAQEQMHMIRHNAPGVQLVIAGMPKKYRVRNGLGSGVSEKVASIAVVQRPLNPIANFIGSELRNSKGCQCLWRDRSRRPKRDKIIGSGFVQCGRRPRVRTVILTRPTYGSEVAEGAKKQPGVRGKCRIGKKLVLRCRRDVGVPVLALNCSTALVLRYSVFPVSLI
jgi:hypothetical protein